MIRYRLRVLALLLLMTGVYFFDPPENTFRDDPFVVPRSQLPAGTHSFFLVCTLLLRLFVTAFVISSAVALSVILFVFCIAKSCKWQAFVKLYGRTSAFVKRDILFLLLLTHTTRIPNRSTKASPPTRHGVTPPGFRDFAAIALTFRPQGSDPFEARRIRRIRFRNHDHAQIRKWLLTKCGDIETYVG